LNLWANLNGGAIDQGKKEEVVAKHDKGHATEEIQHVQMWHTLVEVVAMPTT